MLIYCSCQLSGNNRVKNKSLNIFLGGRVRGGLGGIRGLGFWRCSGKKRWEVKWE
jgi:hypothetical protein